MAHQLELHGLWALATGRSLLRFVGVGVAGTDVTFSLGTLQNNDSDGDGFSDTVEGAVDSDFDGVDEGNKGYPVEDPELLREEIRLYHDAGIHVSVHAIGDRAIDWVVDSYWLALEANPHNLEPDRPATRGEAVKG